MSIKDINKRINITDSLNGNIISVIPKLDTDNFNVLVPLTINEAKMINVIKECINNEHGCQIKVGYIS